MAKPRVHEIAKELGVPSKDLIAKLNELGEYVKGPSSTLEAPVVRKAREAFPVAAKSASAPAPAAKAPATPKPAAPKPAAPAAPEAPKPDADAAPAPAAHQTRSADQKARRLDSSDWKRTTRTFPTTG